LAFTYGPPSGLDFSGLDLLDCGMKPDAAMTSDIVRMVLGVARLGENDLQGWWKGHAIDRTGQYVLSSMFAQAETCGGFVIQQPERTAQGGALRQTKVRLLGRAGRPDNT
jgi:hypothetical protein